MKTLAFLFTTFLLGTVATWSEDEQLKTLQERAAPKYREEYNKLVESGSFEPKEGAMQGKEGSLQRKLWLAGYYAAIMEYIEPDTVIETTESDRSGKIAPHGYGVKNAYAFGYWHGVRTVDQVARKLHRSIVAQLLQTDEADAVRAKSNGVPAENPNSPQDLSKQADRLLEKGEWKAAYAVIEEAHAAMDRVDLTKIPAWYQQLAFKRGWCALKLEKWKEAGEWFETSYRKFADPKDNPYCKLALRGWADAAAGAGDLELSVRLYKKYLTESSKVDWDNPFSRTR